MKKLLKKQEWNIAELAVFGVIGLLLLGAYLIFYYTDYSDTLDNTVLLAEAISRGRFTEFYRYSAENMSPYTTYSADYNPLMYIIFMIWNLPTVIAHLTTDFDYMNSVKALLWAKALIGVAILGCAWMIDKIQEVSGTDKKMRRLTTAFFLGSSFVVLPAFVMVQYDIFAIFFMLVGIYFYMKGDRRGFLIAFAIAIPLKTFALFVFLPLLLLEEKKIWKIPVYTIVVFIPTILLELPFRGDPYYHICMDSQNGDALKLILESTLQIGKVTINPFVILFAVFCVGCFLKKSRGTKVGAIWTSALALLILLSFLNLRVYWIVLLAPFICILCMRDDEHFPANVLLLAGTTTAYSVYGLMTFWAYSYQGLINRLFLARFLHIDPAALKYGNITVFFGQHNLGRFAGVLYSIFFAGMLLILWVNRPGCESDVDVETKEIAEAEAHETAEAETVSNANVSTALWGYGGAFVQAVLTAAMLALIIYADTASIGHVIYDISGENYTYELDLMDGSTAEQIFTAAENTTADRLVFAAFNNNGRRYCRSAVQIELIDAQSGEVLSEQLLGVALMESEKENFVELGGVPLTAGRAYIVRFTGIPIGERCEVALGLTIPESNAMPASYNGELQSGRIVFELQ